MTSSMLTLFLSISSFTMCKREQYGNSDKLSLWVRTQVGMKQTACSAFDSSKKQKQTNKKL